MTKTELLDQMRAARTQLESALAQLNDSQMVTPGLDNNWAVKDLLGHLGWWEQRVVDIFQALKRGELPDQISEAELDAFNARIFAENGDRMLGEIHQREQDAYRALLSLVENATDEDLFNPQRFAWTEGKPFAEWVANNSYGHYEEHREALVQWIKKAKGG